MERNRNVLILGSSPCAMGGIANVIQSHARGEQWMEYGCNWLATNNGGGLLKKLYYFAKSFLRYMVILPKYDLVHIHTSEPSSLIRKTPFFLLAQLVGKKTIVHFHSFSVETTIASRFKFLYRYIFSHASRVIVLSKYWKDALCKDLYDGENVCVVFNPCRKVERGTESEKEKWILYAGILNNRKGYQDLINAFSLIASQHKDWSLVFAGNGEIEYGKELCQELKITNQAKFLGWITGKDKDYYFKKSSVFCLPSYAEGFPMSVLDAWAYGLPVCTTPVGGIPDIAIDGKNCLLFEPGNIKQLADCLEKMISNKELSNKIANESYNIAISFLSEDEINAQIGSIYHEVLKKE